MIHDEVKNNLIEMNEEFQEYLENRLNLTKLHVVETLSKFSAGFAVKLGVLYLLFFAIMFVSLAFAFFLGTIFSSNGIGFLLVALLYIFGALIFYLLRKQIVDKPIIKAYINLLFPNFDSNEDKK